MSEEIPQEVADTKTFRKDLDGVLQQLKFKSDTHREVMSKADRPRASRERSLAITKVQEAIMWLGMDLKAYREENETAEGCENPYPESYNPESAKIEPTADDLKL